MNPLPLLALLFRLFAGWRTYSASVGLLALSVFQFTQGDYEHALQNFLAALAAFGLRQAVAQNAQMIERK